MEDTKGSPSGARVAGLRKRKRTHLAMSKSALGVIFPGLIRDGHNGVRFLCIARAQPPNKTGARRRQIKRGHVNDKYPTHKEVNGRFTFTN